MQRRGDAQNTSYKGLQSCLLSSTGVFIFMTAVFVVLFVIELNLPPFVFHFHHVCCYSYGNHLLFSGVMLG